MFFDEHKQRWIGVLDLGLVNGRRRRKQVTGATKGEASRRLRDLRDLHAAGIDVGTDTMTIAELVEQWRHSDRIRRRQESTLSRLDRRLRDHVVPGIGAHRVRALTVDHIERWLRSEGSSGQSRDTLQSYLSDVRQILAYAERRNYVVRSVATHAELPEVHARSAEKVVLTWDQRDALYAALDSDRMAAYFILLAELGLRPGEADALRWSDLDLEAGIVAFSRSLKRDDAGVALGFGPLKGSAKTGAGTRRVRLTERTEVALRARRVAQLAERLRCADWTDDERWADLVFTSTRGTPLVPSNVRRSLAAACARAKIPAIAPYNLRHTVASLLLDAGAGEWDVADQLGHSDTRMLGRHYRHQVGDVVDTAASVARRRAEPT